MEYPTKLIERAKYETRVFDRVSMETGAELITEVERLRAVLAESCEDHRSAVYDTTTGGGCVLLHVAETEIERLRGIVPEVLEQLNDELCAENQALTTALAQHLMQQTSEMSQPNRFIAYSACNLLKSLGYVWDETTKVWVLA